MSRTLLALAVAGLTTLTVLTTPVRGQVPFREPEARYPSTGKEVPGLQPLDEAVVTMMSRHGIPGAALAVVKDGKLVFARGYGWADMDEHKQVQPDTLFGLASLSKSITAMAVLKLVEQEKLRLDDRVFQILNQFRPLRGARPDPRLYQITIRQLLNHSGGWDRQKSGDPVNWTTQIKLKLGSSANITTRSLIDYTMGMPLDFDPGTASRYCNFGYILLGEVIAKVSGRPYDKYIQDNVLKPMGITRMAIHPANGRYAANEARRYLAGTNTELPAWKQSYLNASGGWTASAVDLARFLCAVDGSRGKRFLDDKTFAAMIAPPPLPLKPRSDGSYVGLGWDLVNQKDKAFTYFKDGSWYGMRGFMKRKPNGVNWVLLFNASMDPDSIDGNVALHAVREVQQAVERGEKFPDIDLFDEYR
ncbi:MAG TPA: serine hydrolase domain-containing protein [Gemmataceae bacterium]